MRGWTTTIPILLLALAATPGWAQGELGAPLPIQAGGQAIDVVTGHAAPWVCDWDGDGTRDLLVGQFGGGKLRIYLNLGTDVAPRFEDFEIFRAGESEAAVPSG